MTALDQAPASIRGWFAAEQSGDQAAALRTVLSPNVVMDFGGQKIEGVDTIVGLVTMVMPPGWLGNVEYQLLPTPPDGWITVRATGAGGNHLTVFVPGAPSQNMEAMDFKFLLDAAGLIVGLAGQAHQPEPPGLPPTLHAGDVPPDFVLRDVHGIETPLRADAKATVVVFISNHCPFSLTWHERLQQVARDYAPRGVRFLNVNANDAAQGPKDSVEYSRKRVADGHFAAPYLIDADQAVARSWGARRTPEVFVLNAQGVIAYHGAPDADSSDETANAGWVRAALDSVLAGTIPSPTDTKVVGCTIKWMR